MKKINNYIILSEKSWNSNLEERLKLKFPSYKWKTINKRKDFTKENLLKLQPDKIFIPHWSYIIPKEIYNLFECILFHMTDLPFGRGGSPLQNLILREFKSTKMTAIKVKEGIDSGDVYLKKTLQLEGSAAKIFKNANKIIEKMIVEILNSNPIPKPQIGQPVNFKRRKPKESNLKEIKTLNKIYDHIRMLDCEDYPRAYLETEYFKFEFDNANINTQKDLIIANVRIFKK